MTKIISYIIIVTTFEGEIFMGYFCLPTTKFVELKENYLNSLDTFNQDIFISVAKKISRQTGIPLKCIWYNKDYCYAQDWYKVNGKWFFYKDLGEYEGTLLELLGEEISRYFDLDTVSYQLARINKEGCGVVSENFCQKNYTYKDVWDLDLSDNYGLSIFKTIEYMRMTPKDALLLANDLKKLFIRDFYVTEKDRKGVNLLFKCKSNKIRLAPLYDYENSFFDATKPYYENCLGWLDLNKKDQQETLLNDDVFQELLYKLMDIKLKILIKNVEDKHGIIVPNYLKGYWLNHDKIIKKYVRTTNVLK